MWRGDGWAGLPAMLVALPSAIAFGVTILSPLGHEYAAQGAVAGILGATAIGIVAAGPGGGGLIIILSQVPKFLGAPPGGSLWAVLGSPSAWQWQGIVVGAITVSVMLAAPKVTKAVPAAILGLAAGA